MGGEQNFLNTNDVFAVLDIINRSNQISKNKGAVVHEEASTETVVGTPIFDTAPWRTEGMEILRESGKLTGVVVAYTNGAIRTITVNREELEDGWLGLINTIETVTEFSGQVESMTAEIFRDDKSKVIKVTFEYLGEAVHEIEELFVGEDENANDFYDGGGSDEGYDIEADDAEDYADYEYLDEDEITPNESGYEDESILDTKPEWMAGITSDGASDVVIDTPQQMEEDFAEEGYPDEEIEEEEVDE